jgi:hypothetical protein
MEKKTKKEEDTRTVTPGFKDKTRHTLYVK